MKLLDLTSFFDIQLLFLVKFKYGILLSLVSLRFLTLNGYFFYRFDAKRNRD